ncbi:MAG: metal ABC transporter ATP-binding protein [Candidatus Mcinerneyibacterium aminivorans]|uniref:Metal ABC transporter ATP-binding protein n=1 Tax=Candidatus Mcinerneyibacterium aminivorans TaxID=2703815 RepID=A0A5D0MFD0_9BACT|nr:MAG: metal ABC transporter ATP-binding protein [Candidatus Mcinerneyibacterium aminivorans]
MGKLLEFKNVNFKYDRRIILEDINFTLNSNEFLGIIGPNGAGKTTLLKLIVGLLSPTEGTIELHTENIGYISQIHDVNWDLPLTVFDAVLMGRYSWPSKITKEDEKIIKKYLKMVDMYEYRNKEVKNLSGGQKQRIFIARALVSDPDILIFDEPNTGVDVKATDQFYDLLMKLKRKNKAIILVTHQIEVIPKICDRVGCLNRKLYLHEKPKEMFNCPVFEEGYGTQVEMLIHGKSIPHRVVKDKRNREKDNNV